MDRTVGRPRMVFRTTAYMALAIGARDAALRHGTPRHTDPLGFFGDQSLGSFPGAKHQHKPLRIAPKIGRSARACGAQQTEPERDGKFAAKKRALMLPASQVLYPKWVALENGKD